MRRPNLPVVVIGVLWWALETHYFGWNGHPGSVAELFADGLALAFFAAAYLIRPITITIVKPEPIP